MATSSFFQWIALAGAIISALGAFGVARYKDIEAARSSEQLRRELATIKTNTEFLVRSAIVKQDTWVAVQIDMVPPGVADYLLLLFRADRGRIVGKVRVKGSDQTALFSTTANDKIPVSVPNLWRGSQYATPTVIEYAVSEATDADARLTILTAGWIDRRGQEPH
jgi:hypothetical protein